MPWLLARRVALCTSALLAAVLTCASAGEPSTDESPSKAAAEHAAKMIGKPYRFGGASAASGFDCCGLVQFRFRQAGVQVPRSTREQRRASALVELANLRPGDLLFFDERGKKNSHVAIYVGGGNFVHAASSVKRVRSARLDSPYWRKHFSEARRLRA